MMKVLTICYFDDYIRSSPSCLMPCPKLDILSKSLSRNPKPDMIVNSKASLAITLLTEYGYTILNEKRSRTATNSAQNGLDHSRSIQYCRMMHIDFAHWMTLPHYPIRFTVQDSSLIWKGRSYSRQWLLNNPVYNQDIRSCLDLKMSSGNQTPTSSSPDQYRDLVQYQQDEIVRLDQQVQSLQTAVSHWKAEGYAAFRQFLEHYEEVKRLRLALREALANYRDEKELRLKLEKELQDMRADLDLCL